MVSAAELKADAAELRELSETATRVRVKNFLLSQVAKLETELAQLPAPEPQPLGGGQAKEGKAEAKAASPAKDPAPAAHAAPKAKGKKAKGKNNKAAAPEPVVEAKPAVPAEPLVVPTVRLTDYALDQSIKFVKIYVNFAQAKELIKDEQLTWDIGPSSLELKIAGVGGKNYVYKVEGLLRDVVPEESKVKVKEDSVLLMLKKSIEGEEWDAVTKVEHFTKAKYAVKKPDVPSNLGPKAGVMKMMKDMYAQGDDSMKREIKKAMWEQQKNSMKR